MKKVFIALALFMLVAPVLAFNVPNPVAVKVLNYDQAGIEVKMTNLDSGKVIDTPTNQYGEVIVDWGGFSDTREGDRVKIEVLGKVKTINLPTSSVVTFSFVDCPEKATCPTCPEVQPCDVEDIDSFMAYIIAFLLLGGGGFIVYRDRKGVSRLNASALEKACPPGCGLKVYKSTNGSIKILHKHYGISGYHNPETRHRDEGDVHARGDIFPIGIKKESER